MKWCGEDTDHGREGCFYVFCFAFWARFGVVGLFFVISLEHFPTLFFLDLLIPFCKNHHINLGHRPTTSDNYYPKRLNHLLHTKSLLFLLQ